MRAGKTTHVLSKAHLVVLRQLLEHDRPVGVAVIGEDLGMGHRGGEMSPVALVAGGAACERAAPPRPP